MLQVYFLMSFGFRSVSRLTELGRVPLAKIENAKAEVRDENIYWIYESILSVSPKALFIVISC